LSSALLYADHRLFGGAPLPMHLHSFAWWVACVVGARARYREALSPRAAAVATVIFALAPCHAMPLAWLANREALISLAFGIFALGSYTRFRDRPRALSFASAALLFGLALFGGGEYALAFGGYVAAIELLRLLRGGLRAEPLGRRLLGWSP